MGSEDRRRREEGEEARDRNEGGGEEYIGSALESLRGDSGISSWSLTDTFNELKLVSGLVWRLSIGRITTHPFVLL